MMRTVHELPGTTFANTRERGGYDSDARAALTVRELERWLALAVAGYHGQLHAGIVGTPAGRWAEGSRQRALRRRWPTRPRSWSIFCP